MRLFSNVIRIWFPLAVAITCMCGIIYVAVQQTDRIGANDPQVQMAQDTAAALSSGQPISSIVPAGKIDIASSVAPYLVVFDDSGKAVAGSGLLHNQLPALPSGVLDNVRSKGESRITWQPEPGVRSATVIDRYAGPQTGFVMAGRSLREVENRIGGIELLISLGWLGTCVAAFVAVALAEAFHATLQRG